MHNLILSYIDPGSGSIILQMLIAGMLGSLFMAKMCWKRITAFFGRRLADS